MFTTTGGARGRQAAPGASIPAQPPGEIVDIETQTLVNRWILAFCETPVLIDRDLMAKVLEEHEATRLSDRNHVRSGVA